MKKQEVLEKAIQKAIDGGWKGWRYFTGPRTTAYTKKYLVVPFNKLGTTVRFTAEGVQPMYPGYTEIIFNHDFAKALWGNKEVCEWCGLEDGEHDPYCTERTFSYPVWQYHLQMMVISDDPIEYLGENI